MTDFEFKVYPKIYGPYKRFTEGPERNKLDTTRWSSEDLEGAKNLDWVFTEKIDGTNIRVGWDGHAVHFGGRTDKAQIPPKLQEYLDATFKEELFEQAFGDQPVVLYGEGYGGKIQKGGNYRPDESFVLFDVRVGQWWLKMQDRVDVADQLGLTVVPDAHTGTLEDGIRLVSKGFRSYMNPDIYAEGIVGVTAQGYLARNGQRLQVKIKHEDFFEGSNEAHDS